MDRIITAIVPIKEHSERLPRKNFRKFNGKPLYYWTLKTLDSVEEIDQVIINTDANEVIEDAPKLFDVEVSVRPDHLRRDKVTTDIIQYEIRRTKSDIYLHTYCTCPLLTASTISTAIREFVDSDVHDSLLPVTKHQTRFYDSQFSGINHDPHDICPSQELEPVYEDNGVLYIYTEATFQKTGHRLGRNPLPFEISKHEAIEIDYIDEFEIAETLHAQRLTSEDK
jgi:N-acylneuraminate cytidylyltransferase